MFWVDVCDTTTAGGSFAKVAKMLGSVSQDMDGALTSLANLSYEQSWLLILDNADDPDFDYSRYRPSGDRGAVIMTSRNPECGRAHQTVGWEELDNLDPDDCITLLMKAAEMPREPESTLRTDAESVIKAVGSHTLAILQAGTYIARGYCKMAAYPEVLNQNRKRLMQFHPKQDQSRYQNAYTTLEASMQVIERSADDETSQDAYHLLNFLSVFHYENFPLAVLQSAWKGALEARKIDTNEQYIGHLTPQHAAQLPQYLSPESDTWDSFRLVQALDLLESLALVKRIDLEHGHSSVSMHPLTHSWATIRQTDEQARQSLLLSECIFALAVYSTRALRIWQPWCDHFRTHALRLLHSKAGPDSLIARAAESRYTLQICGPILQFLEGLKLNNTLHHSLNELFGLLNLDPAVPTREFWPLYRMVAIQARERGNHATAISIFEIILESPKETLLLENDRITLHALYELASSYLANGQTHNATNILKEVIRIGKSNLDNAQSNLLASQHAQPGAFALNDKMQDAIDMFEEILRIRKGFLDNTHPGSQHELASAYLSNGKIHDAIEIFEGAVRIRNIVLGSTHPRQLNSQHALAGAYLANGRIQDAIDTFEEVVRIRKNILDNAHPDRLASQHALAGVYLAKGRIQDAIHTFEEVVRIRKSVLDHAHPHRLASQHELARAYLMNGQFRKAIQQLEPIESIERTHLDEKHPLRLVTQHTLGVAYMELGRVADAIQLLEHVDSVYAETLDENHRERINTHKALEEAYTRRNNGSPVGGEDPSASSPSENECQRGSSSEPLAASEALEQGEDDIEDREEKAEEHGGEVQSTQSSLSGPHGEASQQGQPDNIDQAAANESRSRPRFRFRTLTSRLKGKMKAPRMTR